MTQPDVPDLAINSLPGRRQLKAIFLVVVLLIIALAAIAPHARQSTTGTESFLPAYAAAVCVIEITTGALLLATFRVQRSVALLLLSLGYLFSGLLVPAWVLSFPGIFGDLQVSTSLQATAWIAAIRRIGFATAALGFALCRMDVKLHTPGRWMLWGLGATAACVAVSLWIAFGQAEALPQLMTDTRRAAPAWNYVPPVAIALYVMAILALLRRRSGSLDIWIAVGIFSLLFEIVLLSYMANGVRLSVGWWSGRVFGLAAGAIILIVLLTETAGNYVRLAGSVAAELSAKRNRLTAMEALSATIAHEVNQPLASMVTNADAGLRWLAHGTPDIRQANAAFTRIVEDGHRASKVISGIREMFATGMQERSPVDLQGVLDEAVARLQAERASPSVVIIRDYPPHGTFVTCNPVQLLQVCLNLIENAIDGPQPGQAQTRRVTIRICCPDRHEVETSIIDDGPGVPAEIGQRIFQPFVSTKPNGMGMGLMFCRTVIEAHGGKIWFTPNRPRGAVFQFSLPLATADRPPQEATADDR